MADIQEKQPDDSLDTPTASVPHFFLRWAGQVIQSARNWGFASRADEAGALQKPAADTFAEEPAIPCDEVEAAAESVIEVPVESLVDFSRIAGLHFQRAVLDWRDTTHVGLHSCAMTLYQNFLRQMDREYEELSLFRRVISKSAHEVLQQHLLSEIRWPFTANLSKYETALLACVGSSALFGKFELTFNRQALLIDNLQLHKLEFSRSGREAIRLCVYDMVMGPQGYLGRACEQATELAQKVSDRNPNAQHHSL